MALGRKTGGRGAGTPNKATAPVKILAQAHGEAAIKTLVTLMNKGETEQTQLAAAKEQLNRGYGRPAQTQEISEPGGSTFRIPWIFPPGQDCSRARMKAADESRVYVCLTVRLPEIQRCSNEDRSAKLLR